MEKDPAKKMACLNVRLGNLEKQKPRLECKEQTANSRSGNDFTATVTLTDEQKREGYQIVGGGCEMLGWANDYEPFLLTTGSNSKDSAQCWGKNRQTMSVKIHAILCKVSADKPVGKR